jgi:predicted Zn-dependent protease
VQLSHAAAVSGYGRSLEEEADLEGLKLMAAAGYASNEAPRTYRRLNEIEEPGAVEGFFYSNHPSNSARAEYTERMINSGIVPRNADGRIAAEEFTAAIRNDVFDNIRLRLRAHHYEFALQEVDHALTRYGDDPLLHTYRGDANRRIAEDPRGAAREEAARERREVTRERVESFEAQTSERLRAALAAYRDALELDPSLAIAHRGMGLAAYRTGDHATAAQELQLYLDTESAPFDRRYVEQILEEISP